MAVAAKQLIIDDFRPAVLSNATDFNQPILQSVPEKETGYEWNNPVECRPVSEGHAVSSEIVKLVEKNYCHFSGWSNAFDTILEVMLYALTHEEEKYLNAVKGLKKEALDCIVQIYCRLFKALYYDFCLHDILGEVYMQVGSLSKSKHFGQFFTPMNICDFMAEVQLGDIKESIKKAKDENRKISICDPCVGSGAMLLACKKAIIKAAGLHGLDYFSFYGIDNDNTCVNMCKIQMILTDYRHMANLLLSSAYDIKQKMNKAQSIKVSQ